MDPYGFSPFPMTQGGGMPSIGINPLIMHALMNRNRGGGFGSNPWMQLMRSGLMGQGGMGGLWGMLGMQDPGGGGGQTFTGGSTFGDATQSQLMDPSFYGMSPE